MTSKGGWGGPWAHHSRFGTGGQSWQGGGPPPWVTGIFGFGQPGSTRGPRVRRGDVRAAILDVLSVEPMNGYQIINQIAERTGGAWKPSPGSVYPTLQLLADEGLIRAEESNGRKTFSLTDEGRAEAESASDRSAPWETPGKRDASSATALPKAGIDLAQAAAQVGRSGTPDQIREAVDVLNEARRKLYSILAQD